MSIAAPRAAAASAVPRTARATATRTDAEARDQQRARNRREREHDQRHADQRADLGLGHVQVVVDERDDRRHRQQRNPHRRAGEPEQRKHDEKMRQRPGRRPAAVGRFIDQDASRPGTGPVEPGSLREIAPGDGLTNCMAGPAAVPASAPEQAGDHAMNDPPSASRMLPTDRIDYSAIAERPALQAARRRAHGDLGDRQRRGVGPDGHHAAHGADSAGRRLADARHPELVLARIRQPRRLLAHSQGVRRIQDPRRAGDQRLRHRGVSSRSSRRRWIASGSSSATATPSATCRRCRTRTPTSA